MVGVCVPYASTRKREGGRELGGWLGAICEYQYCLSFSFQLYISEVLQNLRGEEGGNRGETDSTDSGRFNLKQVFHLGRLEI